ncbi:MAG: carotenoid 1,2-hydratase [Sphingomonas sp.]|nr:carotenoid 1,2-hydratase [Sphingomonas sp.]
MRRPLACAMLAIGAGLGATGAERAVVYPTVTPGPDLHFPRDHGAHSQYRTEWWYFTGWLEDEQGKPLGFQITFFRSRPATDPANPSAFAPKQILFAHAALSDPSAGKLIHDQRMARAGFGLAEAAAADAKVKLFDWHLERGANGVFRVRAPADSFALDLTFNATQPVMLNGDRGYSRKGPRPEQASYYYSMPQLAVRGTVIKDGRRLRVKGRGWLDREWSSTLLDPKAAGWDWAGINLDDGGAVMLFQVRGRGGGALYAGGTLRRADGSRIVFGPDEVRFVPRRRWRSPATGALYPVEAEFVVKLPEGERRFPLEPLFDAQELDGRAAGMPAYWEGAVSTTGGLGYLELTGYAGDIPL